MGVIVAFDYTSWAAMFPQFSALTEQQVEGLILPLAQQYHANDGSGPVLTASTQTNLLNLMVAHVAQLMFGPNGTGANGAVGRISNATEGSVSLQTEFPTEATNAWFLQTQWGAMYWQACAPYRTMRYIPANRRKFGP